MATPYYLASDGLEGGGPQRQTSSSRRQRKQAVPYPQPEAVPIPGGGGVRVMNWECPRNGIRYVTRRASARTWEAQDSPAQVSKPLAVQFIASLACNLTESSVLCCGQAVLKHLTLAGPEEADPGDSVADLACKCMKRFSNNSASGFWLMVSLIRLAYECDRYLV